MNRIFRRIVKNKKWFTLNVLSLAIAFAVIMLVFAFIRNELNYDKFHIKSDRVVRFTQNTNTGKSSLIDARVWVGLAPRIADQFPQIEKFVRFSSFRNAIVSFQENSFYTKKAYGVDSTFFEVFDYEILVGDKESLFKHPSEMAISESLAKIYFGHTDVIGKDVDVMPQKGDKKISFSIKAVFKDFPLNSHFQPEILCTLDEAVESWSYSYFLLQEGSSINELQNQIQHYWDDQYADGNYNPIANLQPLTDIHLHSHKSRELGKNGNITNIYLLGAGALILLLIALINFVNLNFVQFISEKKSYVVKTINGATRLRLLNDVLKENLVLSLLAVSLGFVLSFGFAHYFSYQLFLVLPLSLLIKFASLFILLVGLISGLPVLMRNYNQFLRIFKRNKREAYRLFVILQLALSVFAITATFFLNKQINHINHLHPDATSADLVLIPNLPGQAIANYPALKDQVLKHPEIIAVTASQEEPGGIVTDNFPYILEGDQADDRKTINILSVDTNFFSFFKIEAIAGNLDMGTPSTLAWETEAIGNWRQGIEPTGFDVPSGKYIVNEMALKHMGITNAQDAIGKQFDIDFMGAMFPKGEIVGVVDDFHYTNIYVKEKPLVMVSRKLFCHCLLFRIQPNQKSKAIAALESEWQNINPDLPFKYEFVTDSYQKVYESEYQQMRVLSVFSIISIVLSCIGLFAMVAFSLKVRIKEIGVRRVNGAKVIEIVNLLLSSYMRWVIIAIVIACPLVYWAINAWLEAFAYKTSLNWWVFALTGCLMLFISLLTVFWQTFIVARKNPVESLRYE